MHAESTTDTNDARASSSRRWLLWLAAGLVVVVGLWLVGRLAGDPVRRFADWIENLGWWAPAAFMLGYAAATVAFVPGSVLTLVAGALFGIGPGVLYVFVGATVGSAIAFLVARYLTRAAIERRLAGNKRFAALDRAIGAQGRKIVFLLRLSPVFPFVLLNYALGLTKVRFVDYVLASVGMLPGTLLYVYYGKLTGDVTAAVSGTTQRGPGYYALLGLGLVATIVVTVLVTRIARRALAEKTERAVSEGGDARE